MGLDQYASSYVKEHKFDWRKHAKLQVFFEHEWYKTNQDEFNCKDLIVTEDMIIRLREAIEQGELSDSEGGFFYGNKEQNETAEYYYEQDLEFCNWALKEIENGRTVVYSCWY